jgi:hypothetical protein
MISRAWLVLLGAMAAAGSSHADESLSGRDAAYIDWGVKNCAMTSIAREHMLVEQANGKGREAFSDQYMREYQGKSLTEAAAMPNRQEAMCTDIKAWYDPQGSRIADLVTWGSATPPDAVPDKAAGAKSGNRKGGHRRAAQ